MSQTAKFSKPVRILFNLSLLAVLTLVILLIGSGKITPKTQQKTASVDKTAQVTSACKTNQTYDCYKKAFVASIKGGDIKGSLVALTTLNDENQTVKQFCHSLAHDLGRTAYDEVKGDLGKIFKDGTTACWSGFYHGALEKAFSHSKDLAQTARDICTADHGVSGSFLTYQCLHGLGHGLSARFDNEIYSALNICEQLETTYEQDSCYGGVFMEIYVADGINHKTKYVDTNDPIAPCNKVDTKFKYNCYQLVSIQILKLNSYNFGEAFKTCDNSDTGYIEVCYQSVGRDISGYVSENYDQALDYCATGNLTAEKICVMAVSTDSVYSRSAPDNAKIICTKAKDYLKEACYQAAGSSIQVLYDDKSKRLEACQLYEKKYQMICKQAAGIS